MLGLTVAALIFEKKGPNETGCAKILATNRRNARICLKIIILLLLGLIIVRTPGTNWHVLDRKCV